jgi:hypothetical protein
MGVGRQWHERMRTVRILALVALLLLALAVNAVVRMTISSDRPAVKTLAQATAAEITVPAATPSTEPALPAVATTTPAATTPPTTARQGLTVATATTSAGSEIFGLVRHAGTPVRGAAITLSAARHGAADSHH